ncbi:MarR family transcriptional regulator [Rathayibacter sp. PhB127]|uniref:ROK family transcriptional regulator n=1 Tax=Rathayibacter sp. PhB127 TaxID=2485176 RepID=UPI000FBD334F|nr:ROK family transcriptional regulator [Rathayibacter sp. PhB127]ROS21556.1 MarR family transcriptional regulator [Rathayibacter sp. PhB127]
MSTVLDVRAGGWPELQATARAALQLVLRNGPLGRSEMARMLGVSRANLTRATRDLLAAGLVTEGATELRASTGRPIELLEPVPGAYHFVGVKLTGEAIYAAVVDLSGAVVLSAEMPITSSAPVDVAEVVESVASLVDDFRSRIPTLVGLGVSLAGTISGLPGREIVYESTYIGWDGVPLAELLGARTGLAVAVDNDVQALTLAESISIHGHSSELTMALITVGVGIGVGFIAEGSLLRGAHGRPGKLSHLLVDTGGPLCDRGHRGCVSSYLTNASIARNAGAPDHAAASTAARAGDPRAAAAFQEAGTALGVLIGTVVDATDPGLVVLTGDGLAVHALAEPQISEGIARGRSWDAGAFTLDVRAFDFSEWARAAAVMSINRAVTQGRTR